MSYTYLYIYRNLEKMNFIFCPHGEKDLKRTVSKLPHPTWVMVCHTFKALQFQNSCVSILNLIFYLKLHSSLLLFFCWLTFNLFLFKFIFGVGAEGQKSE